MEESLQPVARLRGGAEEILLYSGQSFGLGRAAESGLVINDPRVSRTHAELVWNGTGFTLCDLGSVNGTYVNEERISSASRLLRDGDEIRLSQVTLVYEIVRVELDEPASFGLSKPGEPVPPLVKGPFLVVISGPDMGQKYPLWGEIITIGRASREATWEIRLTDRSVSRPHARVERHPEGYSLLDLGSANDTLLNGVLVHDRTPLHPGDVIKIGDTCLEFFQNNGEEQQGVLK